jgi:hypothetical protein
MSDLVLANRAADWRRLKSLILDSVSSRVYNLVRNEFHRLVRSRTAAWLRQGNGERLERRS